MENRLESNLKIVILESPYDHWDHPLVQQLFPKIISLKLAGYRNEYPYGVLPVDTSDFVATHHLVCREEHGELTPIMGYKITKLDRCRVHGIGFPALTLAKAAGADQHAEAVQEIVTRCESAGINISYDSSWTIHPSLKEDRTLRDLLKNLTTAMLVRYHLESGTQEQLGMGVLRFKTDRYFQNMGYQLLKKKWRELPPFDHPFLLGEKVVLMHSPNFSESALAMGQQFQELWDARITIGDNHRVNEELLKRAA